MRGYGRRWEVQHPTRLQDQPRADAAVIGSLSPRQIMTAVAGEVHTVPGRYIVKRDHTSRYGGSYEPGDVILVYTYLGEGLFRVEFQGRIYMEVLYFSPGGGTGGKRCEEEHPLELCWGELEEELDFTWWVRVETEDGLGGWTHESRNFDKGLFRLARLNGWRSRLANPTPLEPVRTEAFLRAAQAQFAYRAFRIHGGFGDGEIQTGADGHILYRGRRLIDHDGNERYEIEEYTNEPATKCAGQEAVQFSPPVGPETVLKITWVNSNGRWTATGHTAYRPETGGYPLLPWVKPAALVEDAGLRLIRGRPARGVRYPYLLPERAQPALGQQFPMTTQVLWFDIETLLPERWGGEIDDPALRQQLLDGTGYADYGYFFDYDEELELTPPSNSEKPDCVGASRRPLGQLD